jgi:hypothetical protein
MVVGEKFHPRGRILCNPADDMIGGHMLEDSVEIQSLSINDVLIEMDNVLLSLFIAPDLPEEQRRPNWNMVLIYFLWML